MKNLVSLLKEKTLYKNNNINFPLIEKIDGYNSNSYITFVYEGNSTTKNILVVSPLGSDLIEENLMINIKNTNIWYKTYYSRNDIKFRYYFSVNDSLDNNSNFRLQNGCYDKLNDLKLTFDDGHVLSYVIMPNCKKDLYREISNAPKGNLIKYKIYSEFLKEFRYFSIYNPYELENTLNKYGMILFMDGKEHINLLSSNKILDNLIFKKKIPPIFGVFIESTDNRSKDLRCSKEFEKFIIYELIPFIQKKYNISKNPYKNVITGFSLGGLMATYMGLNHPEIFQNVLSQSGSYYFKLKDLKKQIYKSTNKLKFYIDVGILENKKIMIDSNKKLYGILRKNRFKVKYEEFKSGHDFLSWGEFLARGLINLIGK